MEVLSCQLSAFRKFDSHLTELMLIAERMRCPEAQAIAKPRWWDDGEKS
jgi:hypothetical protein